MRYKNDFTFRPNYNINVYVSVFYKKRNAS